MTTLYSYQAKDITLTEAIAACQQQLKEAIALLYSPDSCKFLRLKNREFEYASNEEKECHKLSSVFEARIFTADHELRWLNRENGQGDAVLLTETPQALSSFQKFQESIEDRLDQHYLLWGEPVLNPRNIQGDWQRLAEARIGKLNIPISEQFKHKQQRVYLKTYEYITKLEYGNCVVVQERLISLEVR